MMGQNGGNQNRLFTRLISTTTFPPAICCAVLIGFST